MLAAAGARQRKIIAGLKLDQMATPRAACREIWQAISSPKDEPLFRLFFEVYGLALQDRKRYAKFLGRVVADWLRFIAEPLERAGWPKPEAQAHATVLLAGFRGFLLDLCATRDRQRVNRAVELWLQMLDDASPHKDIAS